MSSVYQPKRKELARVKVVSTETYKNNRKKDVAYLVVPKTTTKKKVK